MIYLVTNSRELFDNENYKTITPKESLEIMKDWEWFQYDSETTGLDCHIDKVLCVQFGDPNGTIQMVVDASTVDIKLYKEFIESRYMIGHNLNFDIKFLYNYGIVPRKIYDTMIVEKLLYLGYPNFMVGASEDIIERYSTIVEECSNWDSMSKDDRAKYIAFKDPEVDAFITEHSGASLKAVCYRYLNIELSKEVRGQIIWRGLDTEVIIYSANDVKYLGQIVEKQRAILKDKGLIKAAMLENNFIPINAYYEWCGVYINEQKWKEKMANDKKKRDEALAKLNKFVVDLGDKKFYYIDNQGDLFNGFDLTPKITINWKSSSQVLPFLTKLGFNCKGLDKKTKEEKDTVDIDVLKAQRDINPEFYDIYEAFSEAQKACSTYGQNYLNAVNPYTKRIHTEFRPLGTDTGRLACGSQNTNESLAKLKKLPMSTKDPDLKCCYPQLQNLPADEVTRACFCAEKGNVWISADYKGEESVLMADFSQDAAMLKVFKDGEDMHSTVAKMIFPDIIPADTPVKDIKKLFKHERQLAKGPEFCFAYGGNDLTLVSQYGMDPADAKSIYTNYMKGFKGVAEFQKKQKKFVIENGYILISPVTGHKSYWWDWKHWKKRQDSFTSDFWDDYRTNHKGVKGDPIATKVSTHFRVKSKYEKNACNSPLQGAGACIYKMFNKALFDWVVDNGYFGKVKFCVPVHDEINVECPKELQDIVSKKIVETMREAGKPFCKELMLDADVEIGDHWIH